MFSKKTGLTGVFIVLVMVFSAVRAFSFETEKTLRLPAEGLRLLRIECGAGSTRVSGDPALKGIEVTARVIVKGVSEARMERFMAEEIRLSLDKKRDEAVLVSEIEHGGGFFDFGGEARIDLTVRIPKALSLSIDDGSGSLTVESVAGDIRIVDGSGSIDIREAGGDVEIEDGSGEVDIRNVGGDVTVDDGSGELRIRDVRGNVVVDDGSGSIRIDTVGGTVRIENEGSGGVDIENVKGRVIR